MAGRPKTTTAMRPSRPPCAVAASSPTPLALPPTSAPPPPFFGAARPPPRPVLFDAIPELPRFPRVQAVVSSCRPVQGARAAAGKRSGTAGTTTGPAQLQGAFADAAVVCLSDPPPAQQSLPRLENKQDQGQALTIRAQPLARAVYDLLQRPVACARETVFQRAGRGADEPGAARDTQGLPRHEALARAACPAAVHATAPS